MSNPVVLKQADKTRAQVQPLIDVINLIGDVLEARGVFVNEIDPERMIEALANGGGIAALSIEVERRRYVLMITREASS